MGLDDGLRLVVQEVERRVLEDHGHALALRVEDVAVLRFDLLLGESRLAGDKNLARVVGRDAKEFAPVRKSTCESGATWRWRAAAERRGRLLVVPERLGQPRDLGLGRRELAADADVRDEQEAGDERGGQF